MSNYKEIDHRKFYFLKLDESFKELNIIGEIIYKDGTLIYNNQEEGEEIAFSFINIAHTFKLNKVYTEEDFRLLKFSNDNTFKIDANYLERSLRVIVFKRKNGKIEQVHFHIKTIKYKEIKRDSPKLLIILEGYNRQAGSIDEKNKEAFINMHNTHNFYGAINSYDCNILFVQDNNSLRCGWYMLDYGTKVANLYNNFFDEYLSGRFNKEDVSIFGMSKGGSAALLFGLNNKHISNIVSFVPKINIPAYIEGKDNIMENMTFRSPYTSEELTQYLTLKNKNEDKKNIIILTGTGDDQVKEQLSYINTLSKQNTLVIVNKDPDTDHVGIISDFRTLHMKIINDFFTNGNIKNVEDSLKIFSKFSCYKKEAK